MVPAKKLVKHFAGLENARCANKVEHHLIDLMVMSYAQRLRGKILG